MPAIPPTPSTQSRIVLINRPKAAISPDIHSGKGTFLLEKSAPVDKNLATGECLIRTEWVSLDPAMRGTLHLPPPASANVSSTFGSRVLTLPPSNSNRMAQRYSLLHRPRRDQRRHARRRSRPSRFHRLRRREQGSGSEEGIADRRLGLDAHRMAGVCQGQLEGGAEDRVSLQELPGLAQDLTDPSLQGFGQGLAFLLPRDAWDAGTDSLLGFEGYL